MNNDNGLSHYLLAGSTPEMTQDMMNLDPNAPQIINQRTDDDNLVVAQLINEMNNIKETQ